MRKEKSVDNALVFWTAGRNQASHFYQFLALGHKTVSGSVKSQGHKGDSPFPQRDIIPGAMAPCVDQLIPDISKSADLTGNLGPRGFEGCQFLELVEKVAGPHHSHIDGRGFVRADRDIEGKEIPPG